MLTVGGNIGVGFGAPFAIACTYTLKARDILLEWGKDTNRRFRLAIAQEQIDAVRDG